MTRSLLAIASVLAGLVLAADRAGAAQPPSRVVSLNLCLDQLALALAAPGQLVGVSRDAQDPHLSSQWRQARTVPALSLQVEAILALRPDLVLLDANAPPHVGRLLRRAGVPVMPLREAATFEEGVVQVRAIADALGRAEAGAALADDMQRRLAAITPAAGGRQPLAAVWQANGFTVGRGTLPDDLLRHAGLRNLAAERGTGPFEPLPLEALVRSAPDLLIVEGAASDRPSLAEALGSHRAARRAFEGVRRLEMPHSLWLCAGPQNLEALERLVAARRTIAAVR